MNQLLILLAQAPAADGLNKFEQITRTFGVHWSLLLSQLVSFLLVCFVLKKYAYGPIMEMLEKRRSRIEGGEKKLEEIERKLAASEAHTAELIAKANADSKRLIDEAKESSAALSERKTQEAIASAQNILAKAEETARAEREQLTAELKRDFGRLVTATTAKVSGKVLNDDDQRRINEEALTSIKN